MRTVNRTIVGAHVYSSDGKLLVALSAPGETYPGCWKIPGGGVDEGETFEQAVIREVKEETGIDAAGCPVELVDDDLSAEAEKTLKDTGERVIVKMQCYPYKIKLDKPAAEVEVKLDPNEFTEYRWIELPELKTLKLSPPSIELFTKLGLL